MPDYEFTVDDLEALAETLEPVAAGLTDREQSLLLAVLALAGRQLDEAEGEVAGHGVGSYTGAAVRVSGPVLPLANGFRASFSKTGVGRLKGWEYEPVEDEIISARIRR